MEMQHFSIFFRIDEKEDSVGWRSIQKPQMIVYKMSNKFKALDWPRQRTAGCKHSHN